ncbi:MAG: DUF4445 domain-containing protein [Clostridia bacterium]|nr:DUF4445 domain-containing protein [Clostridia bacterium]
MILHYSGKTIDTGSMSLTRPGENGNVRLTLYDIILSAKTNGTAPTLHSPCGGHLKCKKCTVCAVICEDAFDEFASGDYTHFNRQLTDDERTAYFNAMHVPADLRPRAVVDLACAMPAFPIITDVFLPDPEEIRGVSAESDLLADELRPVVLSITANLTRPTVENPIDVYTNLYNAVFCGKIPVTPENFGYHSADYALIRSVSDEVVDLTGRILTQTSGDVSLRIAVTCTPAKGTNVLALTAAVVLSIVSPAAFPCRSLIPLGLAIDLGTTTVALSLRNLETGAQAASAVITNPQRNFGADVISRMSYASKHGVDSLRQIIHSAICESVLTMLREVFPSDAPDDALNNILFVSVAGNSVMEHIFAGKSTDSISKAPFFMTDRFGYALAAREVCTTLYSHPSAPVFLAPLAASYIGGDITMGLAYLAQAYPESANGNSLFLDLGTNGEICVIANDDVSCNSDKSTYLLAATAAGPALEGAHIKMGMSAISGAISRVKIPENPSGDFEISSISGSTPVGICGSGLIDAIACALDTGLVTSYGRICDDGEPEEDEYSDLYQIFEDKISETDDGKLQIALTDTVFLHESDIRQVQTAKAAIAAGSQTLLSSAGISDSELAHVYLAGSFGGGIDKKSSSRIGLLPDIDPTKITAVGNTSAKGAAGYMLYSSVRNSLNDILLNSRYTELSGSAEFTELYVDNMIFGIPE